ncbi:SpoIIE family protein phosphatase [Nocardioides pacificus]
MQERSAHTPAYDAVDLATCDREPIHIPGAVQPHGVLLALDAGLDAIAMASANCAAMLGIAADDALGQALREVGGAELEKAVAEQARLGFPGESLVLMLDEVRRGELAGAEVDVRVHRSGERVIVEIEGRGRETSMMSLRSARTVIGRLAGAGSAQGLADRLTREIRELTGFDRVMVYRFDRDWNGEVFAEDVRADLNSFFGLHYPATDIPAQARRLYTVNWTRLIADLSYEPVPLQPVLDPATGAPLDLSHATLRSVSPIHVEYLTNMGVTASMSVSLVVDGQLWGLVACHHYSGPHRPSQDARSAAEFLGQVASQMIVDRERADDREAELATQGVLSAITSRLSASERGTLEAAVADPEMLDLVGAHGVALLYDGMLLTAGTVPEPSVLDRIAEVLERPDHYASWDDHLGDRDPELAAVADIAAGALRLGTTPGRWLLWLRPELQQVVEWGGDPTNKLLAEAEGPEVRLSPRKSFEKWQQRVQGHSAEWLPWQVAAADALGRHMAGLLLADAREQIAMAESLQRSVVLDRAPQFAGVELAARYLPASAFQLGGDWWDAFELPDGRLALVVGDVAGHGVSAASAMTQLRTALRAYLYEGHAPAQCLDRLDLLMDGLLDQRVATAIVVVVDAATGVADVASAGHPAPILVADGEACEVAVDARPLLGVGISGAEQLRLQLEVGQTLLLFSDGVVERRGEDINDGTERLRDLAARPVPGADLDAWVDGLLVDQARTDDDTTVLAVRRSRQL